MLEIILNTNKGEQKHQMKSDWRECSYSDFIELVKNKSIVEINERVKVNISMLSGCEISLVNQFPSNYINGIIPFMAFIDKVDKIQFISAKSDMLKTVANEPWKKIEAVKQILIASKEFNLMMIAPEIVKEYTNIDIASMPFVEAYPIAIHYCSDIESFFKKYTRLSEFKPKPEQIAAGIDKLSSWGFFSTLHALSKGNPLKYDEMLEQPADVIYSTLLFDYDLAAYNERYSEIIKK